jgi:glycerophosphoryl diester phosphodiesterase
MTSEASPFVVAHRAGNDVRVLRRAERLHLALVEADVHLFWGRLEIRHLKTLGPVPVLWDRWRLAPPWTRRPVLGELLAATAPETNLMLDLKGRDARLPARLIDEIGDRAAERSIAVCSRQWSLLEPLRGLPGVRVVHSVGSRRQLDALRRRYAGRRLEGISIHRRLLDPETVADLRQRADIVMTWPVTSLEQARKLGRWGVSGVISEQFELLAAGLAPGGA